MKFFIQKTQFQLFGKKTGYVIKYRRITGGCSQTGGIYRKMTTWEVKLKLSVRFRYYTSKAFFG